MEENLKKFKEEIIPSLFRDMIYSILEKGYSLNLDENQILSALIDAIAFGIGDSETWEITKNMIDEEFKKN